MKNIKVDLLNVATQKPEYYTDRTNLTTFNLLIAPVGEHETIPTDGLIINLVFPTDLFSDDTLGEIKIASKDAPNWAIPTTPSGLTLNIQAQSPQTAQLSKVEIELTGITPKSSAQATGQIQYTLLSKTQQPIAFGTSSIFLTKYPTKKDLLAALDVTASTLDPNKPFATQIYRSSASDKPEDATLIKNAFALTLTHKITDDASKNNPLVTKSWVEGAIPTIELFFIYGNKMGSLTNNDPVDSSLYSAYHIDVQPLTSYSGSGKTYEWEVVSPSQDTSGPIWQLQPKASNQGVLGPGNTSGASVTFTIQDILTINPLGFTTMYLHFKNFPGYDDAYAALLLELVEPKSGILYFRAMPSALSSLNQQVRLAWQTFNMKKIQLIDSEDEQTHLPKTYNSTNPADHLTLSGNKTFTISQNHSFTLNAFPDLMTVADQRIINVTVPNVYINDFKATIVSSSRAATQVRLSWSTLAATSIKITEETRDGLQIYALDATNSTTTQSTDQGSYDVYVGKSTQYVLTAQRGNQASTKLLPVVIVRPGWDMGKPTGLTQDITGGTLIWFKNAFWLFASESLDRSIFTSPNGSQWSIAAQASFGLRRGSSVVQQGGKLWLMGGVDSSGRVHQDVWSSLDGKEWTQEPTAPWEGRQNFGCISFGGYIWVFCGGDVANTPLKDVWRWQPSQDGQTSWEQVTPKTSQGEWQARTSCAVVEHAGKLWLYGGQNSDGIWMSDLWSWDGKESSEWQAVPTAHFRSTPLPALESPRLYNVNDTLVLLGRDNSLFSAYFRRSDGTWDYQGGIDASENFTGAASTEYADAVWMIGNRTLLTYKPVMS